MKTIRDQLLRVIIIISCFVMILSHEIDQNQSIPYNAKCIIKLGDISLDFNELFKSNGYIVKTNDTIFNLNICGVVPQCGNDVSVCERSESNKKNLMLGLLSKMSFTESPLGIRYKLVSGKRSSVTTTIIFECDRHVEDYNITYIPPQIKGKKYNFIFKTPFVCLHKPLSLSFEDNNYNYNLNSLCKQNDNWFVQNVPLDFNIYLNLCGSIHQLPKILDSKECSIPDTHLCLLYKNGTTKNLGIFTTGPIFNDNSFYFNITGGSLCNDYDSIYTKIEFICSLKENGPKFVSFSKCEYIISWFTPAACPFYITKNSFNKINDPLLGSRNIILYKFRDKEINISDNKIIKFNIYGLNSTCNGEHHVKFCLIDIKNKNEIIIGRSNKTLIAKNGILQGVLFGDLCVSNKKINNSVNLNFKCDYTIDKQTNITISDDFCTTFVTIYTKQVCRNSDIVIRNNTCLITTETGLIYNLTSLTMTDNNYEIVDNDDSNLIYIINVCQPVVFSESTICDANAIVCFRNNSIPNLYERFKSYHVNSDLLITNNNTLLINYEGPICHTSARINNIVTIEYKCKEGLLKSKPKLISKFDCEYKFLWETHFACPYTNQSKIIDNNIIKDYNTTNFPIEITTEIKVTEMIPINIEKPKIDNNLTTLFIPIEVSNTTGINLKNCTLKDDDRLFNMNNLPKIINITSQSGRKYMINICNKPKINNCISENCLKQLHVDQNEHLIEMNFYGRTKCNDGFYNSVIFMKCDNKSSNPSVIKEEDCSIHLEWKNKAVCSLLTNSQLNLNAQSSGVPIFVPIVSVFLILGIIASISFYYWRKRQLGLDNSSSCIRRHEYIREIEM